MDPITLGILVVLFSAAASTGLTLAKSPLARAQYAGAVRGAMSGGRTAATDRWAKTAPKRSAVWSGRRKWLSGVQIGKAKVGQAALTDWDMARAVGRTARRGVQSAVPMAVGVSRGVLSGARDGYRTGRQSYRERAWLVTAESCAKCGRTERYGETFGFYHLSGVRLCDECVESIDRKYPSGWPAPSDIDLDRIGRVVTANVDPAPEPAAPSKCKTCGMPIVLPGTHLIDGRCPYTAPITTTPLADPARPDTNGAPSAMGLRDTINTGREAASAARNGVREMRAATRPGNAGALINGQRPGGGTATMTRPAAGVAAEVNDLTTLQGIADAIVRMHEDSQFMQIVRACEALPDNTDFGNRMGVALAEFADVCRSLGRAGSAVAEQAPAVARQAQFIKGE